MVKTKMCVLIASARIVFAFVIFTSHCLVSSNAQSSDDDTICYFPAEFQGTFQLQTQSQMTPSGFASVSYSEVTIEESSIPPWGSCYSRRGNIVILKDSSGTQPCIRCLHLALKTPNVIQIFTEGLGLCYTTEAAARAKCPSERDVRGNKYKELLLFRKHVPGGLQSLEHRFCPFHGRYKFSYISQNKNVRCDSGRNEINNCPHADALNIQLRECSTFNKVDMNFICLGDWENPSSSNGERFLALMDVRGNNDIVKYRCGLYREDASTGRVYFSLSSDSTCINNLKSATDGYESFIMSPVSGQPGSLNSPVPMIVEQSRCRFPDWTQTKWDTVKVDGSIFIYKQRDETKFTTLTSKCLLRQANTANDRFVVYTQSQCGEISYRCVWFKRRSSNILEFQFGSEVAPNFTDSLCDDRHFTSNNWITQGKSTVIPTACPITGHYTGVIPQSHGFCAKISSDCNNPDIMFYAVISCENRSHVYEERVYRCLGNWEEDSILYTFTQRMEMPGYQCLAGKILRSGEEVFIKEAGDSCIRGEDPFLYGMNITREAPCPRHVSTYTQSRPVLPSSGIHKDSRHHHKLATLPLSTQLPPSSLSQATSGHSLSSSIVPSSSLPSSSSSSSSSVSSSLIPSSPPSQYSNTASILTTSSSPSATGSISSSTGTIVRSDTLRPFLSSPPSSAAGHMPSLSSSSSATLAKPDYFGYSPPSTSNGAPYYFQDEPPAPATPSKPWKSITSRPLLFPNSMVTPSLMTPVNSGGSCDRDIRSCHLIYFTSILITLLLTNLIVTRTFTCV